MGLPLWIEDEADKGLHRTDVSRAAQTGLTHRPLAETVEATLDARRDDRRRRHLAPSARRRSSTLGKAGSITPVEGFDFVHREPSAFGTSTRWGT